MNAVTAALDNAPLRSFVLMESCYENYTFSETLSVMSLIMILNLILVIFYFCLFQIWNDYFLAEE